MIYETRAYVGNILLIRYKNNVEIQINTDYEKAKQNCASLKSKPDSLGQRSLRGVPAERQSQEHI
jgi:hypothetical protein